MNSFINAAVCKNCGDLIRSCHVHDFKMCKCGSIHIDGGNEYCKRGATDIMNILDVPDHKTYEWLYLMAPTDRIDFMLYRIGTGRDV